MNFLASSVSFENSLTPAHRGNKTSILVIASCVALFIFTDFLAKSILKDEDLLCLPVTLPYSVHPRATASSGVTSFRRGPAPTLVTKDLKTTRTSSTLFGPIPTSEQIPDAVTSFEVT